MKTPAEIIDKIIHREVKRLPESKRPEVYARNRAECLWQVYASEGRQGLFAYLERG